MAIPKKVYVHDEENPGALKPRTRSNGRRPGSFQFRFRSSNADESSLSTNSYMGDEDELQPVFQDVVDALYTNQGTIMEAMPELAKLEGDKAKNTAHRRATQSNRRNNVVRSQRREERPARRSSSNNGSRLSLLRHLEGDKTKTMQRFPDPRYAVAQAPPDMSAIDMLSVDSDEPISSEWRESSVSVRTEDLTAESGFSMVRQPSYPISNTLQRNYTPTMRSTLPRNKPRRAQEFDGKNMKMPRTPPLANSKQRQSRRVPRSQSPTSKKVSAATRAMLMSNGLDSEFPKSRTRSFRGRSLTRQVDNLESIPAFARSSSHGSRGPRGFRGRPTLFLRRSRSRNRSRSRERTSTPTSMTKLPRQSSLSSKVDALQTIKLKPSTAQQSASKWSQTADVVPLDSVLAQVLVKPTELLSGFAKDCNFMGCLMNCSTCIFYPEGAAIEQVEVRDEASTLKETAGTSEQASQKREDSVDKCGESTARQGPEIQRTSSKGGTKIGRVRSYLNFLRASKGHGKSKDEPSTTSTAPSTIPSLSQSSLTLSPQELPPPIPLAAAVSRVRTSTPVPPPTSTTTATTNNQVEAAAASPPTAAARSIPSAPTNEAVVSGSTLPPLSPQSSRPMMRRSRSGNLQMLRIRFHRNSSYS